MPVSNKVKIIDFFFFLQNKKNRSIGGLEIRPYCCKSIKPLDSFTTYVDNSLICNTSIKMQGNYYLFIYLFLSLCFLHLYNLI